MATVQETRDAKTGATTRQWLDPTGTPITEAQAATAATNEQQLFDQARAALAANRAFLAQAKPATAAAQASSAYDQAKALTRQMNGVLRLLLGDLSGTD